MCDHHGNTSSIGHVIKKMDGEQFDFVIHVGDFTNGNFDGLDEGAEQLDALVPPFRGTGHRGDFVYVWGNRDYELGIKGMGQ